MNELNSYQYHHRPPLTAGARFIRGFRRIGTALALVAIAIGLVSTIWASIYDRNQVHERYAQAVCIITTVAQNRPLTMSTYSKDEINLSASGCRGPGYMETFNSLWATAQRKPDFFDGALEPIAIGLPITIGAAAFFYFSFWAIGWLCAGFTRD